MKNDITKRLLKAEAQLARTELVRVEHMHSAKDVPELVEMDLLDAIKLFTQGKIYNITAKLTPLQKVERHQGIIREIEAYVRGVNLTDLEDGIQ